MAEKKKLTLAEKVFAISNRCSVIEKKGVGYGKTESDPPTFAYARIEDVLDAVNPLLKRYKLLLTGQVAKEPISHVSKGFATTEVLVDWTLEDLESPPDFAKGISHNRVFRVPGAGTDDQGTAISRALTNSRKQAYILIFNLKFGDEPQEVKPSAPRTEERPAGNPDEGVSR